MPSTIRGVYHNLKESKYTISNSEVVFFFSSKYVMNKFLINYTDHRMTYLTRLKKLDEAIPLNFEILADIKYYKTVEKRGFRVTLKGSEMTEDELYKYSLRKMVDEKPQHWFRVVNPRTLERMETFVYE
jgi:hypothetical protein